MAFGEPREKSHGLGVFLIHSLMLECYPSTRWYLKTGTVAQFETECVLKAEPDILRLNDLSLSPLPSCALRIFTSPPSLHPFLSLCCKDTRALRF